MFTARRQASNSDSDEDVYGGARGRDFRKKQRRLLNASGRDTPTHGEVRFSTRRAAKVSNYNEDEEHGFSEEDDSENHTPNYWAGGAEEYASAIDLVLNHRVVEGKGPIIMLSGTNMHLLTNII